MSRSILSDPRDRQREECLRLHHCWPWFLILGVLLIVVGCLAIGAGLVTTLATVFVFGCLLLGGGIVQLVNAFVARGWRGFFLHVLAAVLHLIVGLLMIQHPLRMAAGLTLVLAAAFMVGGVSRILITLFERFAGWAWVMFNGVITLLLGVSIWQQWPESTEWVIGLFVGLDMIFNGWSWVMLGLLVKSVTPATAASPEQVAVVQR